MADDPTLIAILTVLIQIRDKEEKKPPSEDTIAAAQNLLQRVKSRASREI